MDTLKIENNYSWFISDNDEVKNILWKKLRFRQRNYYHSPLYRQKKWDGYTDFFKKETGRFLTGILPEIRFALKYLGVNYKTQDERNLVEFSCDKVDENLLNKKEYNNPVVLRDYQVDYINQAIRNHRGIVPSPTGSGKTFVLVGILKCIPPDTPTLVLANRKQLVEQNYDEIKKWDIPNVGKFHGNTKKIDTITCATVQSAHLLLDLLPTIKVLIVDEIHEMMSKRARAVYSRLKNASVRIGMSATAFKFGGSDKMQKYEVKGWIGPMFASFTSEYGILTTKSLQDREILSKVDCVFYPVNEPMIPYDVYLDAVTKGIAENNYFHGVVASIVSKLNGRSLIIVERIEHGDRLQAIIPNAQWVKGEDNIETRKLIINKLNFSKENVIAIATSGIFNTGIDVKVHNLINAAGGQADHQIIQRLGRGLRVSKDKENLKYFDFVFHINDYLHKHSEKRIKVLSKEGHSVNVLKDIDI